MGNPLLKSPRPGHRFEHNRNVLGQSLLHYQIIAKLGQGGMGEVYRARDTKLDREVAIKFLPPTWSQDKERLARFEREAKVLAQLNHPNIAMVHGFDQVDGTSFLVMEYIDGDDLAVRLKRGPLPVDEGVSIARQIAEGLEAAHEKGIIHRDLKPANIKLSAEGHVKILDFGLAKALESETGGGSSHLELPVDDSPTITDAFTQPGTVLGTAAYMSPEQAKGKRLDHRTDIWSFGCVVFELLTGQRAFAGDDVSETMASILREDPDWTALPRSAPQVIQVLLRKCLVKDSKGRLRDIGDARIDLDPATSELTHSGLVSQSTPPASNAAGFNRLLWVFAVLMTGVMGAVLAWWFKPDLAHREAESIPFRHLSLNLDVPGHISGAAGVGLRLSPDGTSVAYMVGQHFPAFAELYIQRFDELKPRLFEEAYGVVDFSFSPDGQWIVFRKGGSDRLMKALVAGGPAEMVCRSTRTMGIEWADPDWIVFAAREMGTDGAPIYRVPAKGGEPEIIASSENPKALLRHPTMTPDGKTLVYTESLRTDGQDRSRILAQPWPRGDTEVLVEHGSAPRFFSADYMTYGDAGTLFAKRFDAESVKTSGAPIPLLTEIARSQNGVQHADFLPMGSMVYLKGDQLEELWDLLWIDRDGEAHALLEGVGVQEFRLSPKAPELAFTVKKDYRYRLFVLQIESGRQMEVVKSDDGVKSPVWSPTGDALVYSISENETTKLIWHSRGAMGGGQRGHEIYSEARRLRAVSWHPSGKFLSLVGVDDGQARLLRLVFEEGEPIRAEPFKLATLQETEFSDAAFSPDGQKLAFHHLVGETVQVSVVDFPSGSNLVSASVQAVQASSPVWSLESNELLYIERGKDLANLSQWQVMACPYQADDQGWHLGAPTPWKGGIADNHYTDSEYDVHSGGDRILVRRRNLAAENDPSFQNLYLINDVNEFLRRRIEAVAK